MNNRLTLAMLGTLFKNEGVFMKKIAVLFLCVLCLTGCGKRGKLDFPSGTIYPRQYPAFRQPKQGQMKPVVQETPENAVKTNVLTGTEE